jgi:rRNA processing protein Krr1/Pno1
MLMSLLFSLLYLLNLFLNDTYHLETFTIGRFIIFRPRLSRNRGRLAQSVDSTLRYITRAVLAKAKLENIVKGRS